MAVDMRALAKAASGDPGAKVTVNKGWLAEVHRLLSAADETGAELARLRNNGELGDRLGNLAEQLFNSRRR